MKPPSMKAGPRPPWHTTPSATSSNLTTSVRKEATEWSVGTVFSMLDARYEDMHPTIFTSKDVLAGKLSRGVSSVPRSKPS